MTDTLLETFGLYGGVFVLGFVSGLIPINLIELFLMGIGGFAAPGPGGIVALILLSAVGHQLAKTVTYYMGVGALENKKLEAKVEKLRARIDRWNKRPKLILFLGATIGLPPLLLLGFIAHPLMGLRFIPFTVITFVGRVGRYTFMILFPMLF